MSDTIKIDEKEKSKFLYEYSKEQFKTELDRFKSTEDKAVKFITLLSVIIVGFTALVINTVKYLLDINDLISTSCLISMGITSVLLIISLVFIFKSITFKTVPRLTLDQNMIDYINYYDISTVYKKLSDHCLVGINSSRETTKSKQKDLANGYKGISISVAFLVVSLLLLAATQFNPRKGSSLNVERSTKTTSTTSTTSTTTIESNNALRSK